MTGRRSTFKQLIRLLAITLFLLGFGTLIGINQSQAEEITKTITIDGNDVDEHNRFKGFGTVSGNNTSRLLLDYKEEHPEKYWEIMNQLFNKETGAGLTHVKVELGGDINSSSGTEPATMRYEDEPANVLRGAGFQFAADAKSINPAITTEILRWGEPRWTWNGVANQDYENRYQWYKQTIDAVNEEYGFQLDYIGISQNERAQNGNGRIDVEWLEYFTSRIKEEPNYEEDYQDIKLVAADGYRDTETISGTLLDNPDLIDEIDVISSHYGLTGSNELSELQDQLIAEGKEPKELWVSEGIAPMINARYRENMEPHYNGLGGRGGIIDVTSRIISVYSWEGAGNLPLNAVSFDFQPSVAAFYQGAQYNPKHLISAFDPWSGFYEVDGGLQGVRHVMNFVGYDDPSTKENERWQYIKNATYSDGNFFDGGVDVDTSTHNYMTLKDPETDDYTTVFANNTKDTRKYTIELENLDGKEDAEVFVWETRGPEEGQDYDENWFQHIENIQPEDGTYEIEVKPYSILTISTLDKETEIDDFAYQSDPVDLSEDTIMPLPYTDDFEYDEYPEDEQGRDYIERRGGTPRYTTDQIGAFEVVKEATKPVESGSFERTKREIPDAEEHGSMLQQKITPDIIGADWAVWGGTDGSEANVNPNTNIGDFRWANYKVSYDFLLDTHTPEAEGRENYALIGVRQVKSDWSDSQAPYNARIYKDGKYEILKLGDVVEEGTVESFDNTIWHNLAFEAKGNIFTLYLDDEEIASYTDEDSTVMSGRVTLGSGYYETLIDNLKIEPIKGYAYESLKLDNAQGKIYDTEEEALENDDQWNPIGYVGDWEFIQAGYGHYNRTQMSASSDYPVWNGITVEHTDTTNQQGTLNKVYYSGDWGSNSGNAWGNDGDSFDITFKGNAIRLYGEANPSNGTADIYLDGELVGEANYLNNSSIVKKVWEATDLEETEHTLKVVAKEAYTSFVRAEIETDDPIDFEAVTTLAPNDFTAIADDSEIGNEENTVYAYRENGNTWGANSTNAWADFNDNPYIFINFTGTGIDYLAGAENETTYHVELDGESVDNFDVEDDGIRYSVRGLEDKAHTLKVSLGDNEAKEQYMDYRGVNIYSTPEESEDMILFDFKGNGFNLFGATSDALIDVYIDDQLVEEDYRVYPRGDRQTSYHIRGLKKQKHTAKIVVKAGNFVLDGIDIITGASPAEKNKEKDKSKKDKNKNKDKEKDKSKKDKNKDKDLVKEAAEALKVYNIDDVRGNLTLPIEGKHETTISWESEDPSVITTTGEVTRPEHGEGDVEVTLAATVALNGKKATKEFVANVKEMPEPLDYQGYLFSYFTGEGSENGEQIYFALSEGNDPLHWQQLNDGDPVITSKLGEKGLRDPFIIRSPEGDKFYMIATDLKINGNWDWNRAQTEGSRSIMVWESTDLVNWSEQRLVEVAPEEAGNTWAPEIFYDDTIGKYVVFWASKLYDSEEDRNSGDSYQRMMYTTTRDFHTFSEPEVYLDYGYSIIDTTMVEHDDKIYRFTKDERVNNEDTSPNGKFIFQEVGDSVLDPDFEMITEGIGKGTISQGEGPAIFKSNTEEKWYLFIDEFGGQGYVPFETTDLDSGEWTVAEDYDLPSHPRHGTVLPITEEEYDALLENVPSEIKE
ncbi:immunoglobulin-like domain-containing protein [Gracilibacillus lacisalsi]|uniref:immunoglobulin-like domain-containing protein n=1 Tax=Gracilibacillus lacisalsi TaxID=393087 RepID=UPI0003807F89|nr:immunoglobulin-like domain-containing protein [Gracilibacillus lacisalsi]